MSQDTPTPRTAALAEYLKPLGWKMSYKRMEAHAIELEVGLTAAQQENAELRAKCERLEKRNGLLTIRGLNVIEDLDGWLPALDSCQQGLANKVRLFRDVLGSKAAQAASEKGATP